ncbi:MAG: SoxR reducing system RseC family protein [Candidatus Syntrophosphaera sp.]|nr:SoxR reducing system RseC family protein [Candidatus Syntrophosphaera sp.]
MEEQQQTDIGTVVEVKGNRVRVELVRGAGCKSCSLRGMCFGRNTPAVFDMETELDLSIGDKVQLEIAPGTRVLSAVLVFGLPLAFLFAAFMLARAWLSELASIGIAFAATAISFFIIRYIDRQIGGKLQVRIGGKL